MPQQPERRSLQVVAAHILGSALHDVARDFERDNPDVHIELRLGSSRQTCSAALTAATPPDLLLAGDAALMERLLVPEVADATVRFAPNALVLAYAPDCPMAPLLRSGTPWQELLASGKYRVGIANPQTSPVGIRALLALKLNDLSAAPALRLGRRIASKLDPVHQRADVSRLVAPLKAHELDAAFIYRSEALQHGLPFVSLNRRVDFSDPNLHDAYAQVSLSLPGSDETIFGSPVMFGLALPRAAKEPALAAKFVRFMLSERGRALAQAHKLPLLSAEQVAGAGRYSATLLAATAP